MKLLKTLAFTLSIFLISCSSETDTETNILQAKFEEQRATLYSEYTSAKNQIKKSAVFNRSRKNTCDFVQKNGSSFINWYGEITRLSTDQGGDEVNLTITSNENGIKVAYIIYGIKMKSDLYDQISNYAEGEYVYFNFTPQEMLAINSTENECFDEISLSEYGSLSAPEFLANITRIGSEPDDITQEEMVKLEDVSTEEVAVEAVGCQVEGGTCLADHSCCAAPVANTISSQADENESEDAEDLRLQEEIVTSIRENFYGLKDIWDDLIVTKINDQITIYSTLIYPSENNHFCGIIKSNGVTNEFYVKNDKLYFVYNFGNGIENRYYFNNNVEIVRWLDSNKGNILEKRNEEQKRLMDIFNQIY